MTAYLSMMALLILSKSNLHAKHISDMNGKVLQGTNETELHKDSMTCNKEQFVHSYVNKSIYLSYEKLHYITNNCSLTNVTCGKASAAIWYISIAKEKPIHYTYQWGNLNIESNKDCWGYLIQIKSPHKTVQRYINFKDKMSKEHIWVFETDPDTEYESKIISIPTLIEAKVKHVVPGVCESGLFKKIHGVYETLFNMSGCVKSNEILQKTNIAKQLCELHPSSFIKRTKELQNLQIENCALVLRRTPVASWDDKMVEILIISLVSILCVIVCIVVLLKIRSRKNLAFKCWSKLNKDDCLMSTQRRVAQSVLILYPHGCVLLHQMLRATACIISSYGIKVKLALLESTKLDVNGGISKYYEEHIIACDYTLVFCTDITGPPLRHHKPFMFALSMLSGQAFHNNDNTSYIPLYIGSLDKNIIPKFLISDTSNVGFRIPDDIYDLIAFLLVTNEIMISNEMNNKNKIHISCINTTSKKYLLAKHNYCNKQDCKKGQHQTSSSFASSIFSSMKTISGDAQHEELCNLPMSTPFFASRSHSLDTLL